MAFSIIMFTTHLYPPRCATSPTKIRSFLRVLRFVVGDFLVFVDSRLQAVVDEREVRSRRESVPRSKQQRREILIRTPQCWRPGSPWLSSP